MAGLPFRTNPKVAFQKSCRGRVDGVDADEPGRQRNIMILECQVIEGDKEQGIRTGNRVRPCCCQ